MSATKEKIIIESINLFNEHGFTNTRLQHIADGVNISVGNLVYHFKNKEAIISTAYNKLGEELKTILSKFRTFPGFIDFDYQLDLYFEFVTKYPFYFVDILEIKRSFPHLHEDRLELMKRMESQLNRRFIQDMDKQLLQTEPFSGCYKSTAENICGLIQCWVTHNLITENDHTSISQFKKRIWALVYPFFTNKGLEEYQNNISTRVNI